MKARFVVPCEELRRLYVDEGLSQAAIGRALGCSPATVGIQMRRCAIAARDGRFPARQVPRALLAALYSDQNLTLEAIAAQLGVSVSTVHNWRRAYGIPRRLQRRANEKR
jgi:DNA-directed RNA polymerase specialized sigma24 family protein